MGNHEYRHLLVSKGNTYPAFSQNVTRYQLGENRYGNALTFMEGLPTDLELPEAVLIHGYLEPRLSLDRQDPEVLVGNKLGE